MKKEAASRSETQLLFIDFSSVEWNPLVRSHHGTVDAGDLARDSAIHGRADAYHGAGILIRCLVVGDLGQSNCP